jgi:predicted CoA-binding protein
MSALTHPLAPLLAPRSLALVGASPRPGSNGHGMIVAARSCGFEGALYLVNPRYDEIEGEPCYPSLDALPETPEHASIMLANERVEAAIDAAIAAGAKAATIFASCYLESDTSPRLLERLKHKAREAGLKICGGNGMGFYNRVHKVRCVMDDEPREEPGPVALISHSGSIFSALSNNDGRLRFNLTVSPGQEIATSAAEYMDFALELPSTRVIGLFLETIRDPEGFIAAAEKAAARDIPIVAIKVARTEQSARFAVSHSGAIAGDDSAYDAVFERYGVLRCDDVDAFFATCQLLSQPWRVGPGGIAAITDSGGERELLVDCADAAGVRFARIDARTRRRLEERLEYGLQPENPLDAWGTGRDYGGIFRDCMGALLDDPDTALGVWVTDMRDGDSFREPFVEDAPSPTSRCSRAWARASPPSATSSRSAMRASASRRSRRRRPMRRSSRVGASASRPALHSTRPRATHCCGISACRRRRPRSSRTRAPPAPQPRSSASRWYSRRPCPASRTSPTWAGWRWIWPMRVQWRAPTPRSQRAWDRAFS